MSIKNRSKQEVEGLLAHKLPVGKASQLSDAFVLGMRFEQSLSQSHDMVPTFTEQEKVISELQKQVDNLQIKYGDAWFDGFMEAQSIHNNDGNLEDYSSDSILHLSEHAEEERTKHKQSKGE